LKTNEDEIDLSNVKLNKNETTQSHLNMSINTKMLNNDLKKKVAEEKFVESAINKQKEVMKIDGF